MKRRDLFRGAVALPLVGSRTEPDGRPVEKPGRDSRLRTEIIDGELRISIGVDTLAGAHWEAPYNDYYDADARDFVKLCRVTNPDEFAKAVRHEIDREAENGDTPLYLFLDKVMLAAIENGCEGVEDIERPRP